MSGQGARSTGRRRERAGSDGPAVHPSYARIWAVVRQIPCGRVASYGEVAARAGLPRRARLVGRALRECPADVPWHRVLTAQGRIAFAMGSRQFARQRRLLEAEGLRVRRGRVDPAVCGSPPQSLDAVLWRPDGWS